MVRADTIARRIQPYSELIRSNRSISSTSLPITCPSSSEAAGLCNLHRDIFALHDRVLIFGCDEFRDHLAIAVRDLRLGTRSADRYAVPDAFVEFLRW